DRQLEAARLQTSQTSAERDARRAALNGYQRRNEILTKAGVGTDQSSRIQALAKAVEHIRVDDGGLVTPSTAGWVYGLLTSALVLIAGFSSWLAVVRGRRLSAARRMSELLGPVHDAKFPRNVGGNAA
ncbi:MAG TPA: hypothetical protein VGR38_02775, partial [Candidatus Polarisedimenticolia bacterium]|nr:hypothetical protein [Candidatus Polarisedimenticolia bacterium]